MADTKKLESTINAMLAQDVKTLAACELLSLKIIEAEKKGIKYDASVHATVATALKNIEARQKQLKDKKKEIGFAEKLLSVPKSISNYVSNVLSKTANWVSSLFGTPEQLGIAPAVIAAVALGAGALASFGLIKLFEGSGRGAAIDWSNIKNSNALFDAALKGGLPPAQAEEFKASIQAEVDKAYKAGKSESTWGWVKTASLVGGALLVISFAPKILNTELSRYQAKRAA